MAIILSPGQRVCNAAGTPVSGGKVRVYQANTTTLASLYSDPALTVAISNPVIASSAGYPTSDAGTTPTLIFAAAGNYDIAFLDASNNVLVSFNDTPSVGSDEASLTKDFTNARFQVRGSGGTVYVEAGDPSPDNIGGTMRLGGWNGTEADLITLDGALVNVDGDNFKVNSKKLPSVVYTPATTVSAVTNLDITLPNSPSGIRGYSIDIWDFFQSQTTNIRARLSYDNAATFKSGAGDYGNKYLENATWTLGGTDHIELTNNSQTPAGKPGLIHFDIWTPDSGTDATVLRCWTVTYDNTGTPIPEMTIAVGFGLGGYGRATTLRLYGLTGGTTLSAKYRVTPLRGTGEA